MKRILLATLLSLMATTSHGETRYGDWTVTTTHSDINGTNTYQIFTDAIKGRTGFGEVPYLAFDCRNMSFGNLAVLDDHAFYMRFSHQEKKKLWFGRMHKGYDGVNVRLHGNTWKGDNYKGHFQNALSGAKYVHAEFSMHLDPTLEVTFSLRGFPEAITWLRTKCGK